MEKYKTEFIELLLENGSLKIGGNYKLKSGRSSPYFINIGDINGSKSTAKLGRAYAKRIKSFGKDFNLIYGIPEKGVSLAIATSIGFEKLEMDKPWFFTRKIPKEHGEATAVTNISKEEKRKKNIVGRIPKPKQKIGMIDDVFTTGDAKYEALVTLKDLLDEPEYAFLAIAIDRQEVGIDGKSAIEEFTKFTDIPVISIANAYEIYQYAKGSDKFDKKNVVRMEKYLRVYGTDELRKQLGPSEEQIIVKRDKSIIPACDVDSIEKFEEIVKKTVDIEGIGGYKIPSSSGEDGWKNWIRIARKYTDKPLIYDHQKAGNDIPDTGPNLLLPAIKRSGFDAVILFPHSGPETERAWIYGALDLDLKVIAGGWMTHPAYTKSEGGFITDEGAIKMYRIAARAGINNFVVPGNKIDVIKKIKEVIQEENVKDPIFYAPGFVAQGGSISEATKVAGSRWHAIVGTGIIAAEDKKKAAQELVSQL